MGEGCKETAHVTGIQAPDLDKHWRRLAILLKPAVDGSAGRATLDLLYRQIKARDIQLWAAFDQYGVPLGAWTSHVAIYPGSKVCELQYCGGRDLKRWLSLGLDLMEAWACSKGCDSITIVGRTGWGRITEHRGYGHFATIIEKKLKHGQIERRRRQPTADSQHGSDATV